MIRGSARFDGLAILEGSFNFLGSGMKLEGKAAFVSTKTGDTHGWTTNTQWSPQVVEKLKELRALMELDLGRLHLEGGGEILVAPAGVVPTASGPSGLGEHVRDEQV
jgi:hypothetical protein